MDRPKGKKGAPQWTTTFADLSTLLLTFFVLMLSFANIDIEKFRSLLGSIQDAFGVQKQEIGEYQAMIKDVANKVDSLSVLQSHNEALHKKELQQMAQQIAKVINENHLQDHTEIEIGSNGVRIRITGNIMFDPGRADLKPQSFKFLNGIYEAANSYDFFLLVEGHTDSLKISTPRYPSNWELSGARASAVVRYLIGRGLDPKRLSGIGHAYNYPIASNKTASGRNQNRRVEFIFTRNQFRSVLE